MNSIAYNCQPDYAKVVLIALAARYQGHNNGDLSLPFSEARQLGVGQQWKLYAGLQLLRGAGLIEVTRQGMIMRGRKLCSLFAVAWKFIDKAPEGIEYDAGIASRPASNAWAQWEKPKDWLQIVKDAARRHHGQKIRVGTTTVGAGRTTTVGAMVPKIAQLRGVTEKPFVAPTVDRSSKTLAVDSRMNGTGHAVPASKSDLNSTAQKFA